MIMIAFGLCGTCFIGAALITPSTFLSGFFYWVGASCITCVLWIGFMLSKKTEKTAEYKPHYNYKTSKDDDFTLMLNDSEHWEKPHWIVANSGSLERGMLVLLMGGEYVKDKGDLRLVRTKYVKDFLEEHNGTN